MNITKQQMKNDEETFGIKKENTRFALCMPYDRLIGWAYVDERVITDDYKESEEIK